MTTDKREMKLVLAWHGDHVLRPIGMLGAKKRDLAWRSGIGLELLDYRDAVFGHLHVELHDREIGIATFK